MDLRSFRRVRPLQGWERAVFSRGGGSGRGSGRRFGHAFILANFPARNAAFRYDVNPSEDSAADWMTSAPWKKYTGIFEGVLTVQPTTLAEATKKAYGMLKVASHNLGQFAIWNVAATAIAMGPDPLQYRMASIPGLSDTVSCYSWAIGAATSAFFIQFLPTGG